MHAKVIPFPRPASLKLKIVVLDSPVDCWSDPLARKLFTEMVDLKLKGFRSGYDQGVLPVDSSDFVCTHYMVCVESNDELKPLLAYRLISEARARKHAMKFPGLSLVEGAKIPTPDHVKVVQAMIERSKRDNAPLVYGSSYTVPPEIRGDRELVHQLKNLFTGIQVLSHRTLGIRESLVGGVVRFKTDLFFSSWGYERVCLEGRELPTFSNSTLFGEPVYLMRLKEFSPEALACAEQTLPLWELRWTLQGSHQKAA